MLRPEGDSSLIDICCGTGYFTRLLTNEVRGKLVAINPDEESLRFPRAHAVRDERYEEARGEAQPFGDGAFDFSVSVAAQRHGAGLMAASRRVLWNACGRVDWLCGAFLCVTGEVLHLPA